MWTARVWHRIDCWSVWTEAENDEAETEVSAFFVGMIVKRERWLGDGWFGPVLAASSIVYTASIISGL